MTILPGLFLCKLINCLCRLKEDLQSEKTQTKIYQLTCSVKGPKFLSKTVDNEL